MTGRAVWTAVAVGVLGVGVSLAPSAAYAQPTAADTPAAATERAAPPLTWQRAAPPLTWQRVTASATGGAATVACPSGLAVYGVGGVAAVGSAITGIVPSEDLTTATATATGFDLVTVHAVCGPPLANLHRVTGVGTAGTATVTCPKFSELQGLGMQVDGDAGASLLALEPDVGARSARVELTAAEPVRVYAICATIRGTAQMVRATEGAQGQVKVVVVQCPAGTHVHATSAGITEPTVIIDKVVPNADLTSVTVTARSAVPGRWYMDATALCG